MKPVVDGLRPEYSAKVDFKEIDFYEHKDLAEKYGAPGHPTLVVLSADGSKVGVLPGVVPRSLIVEKLDEALK